MERLDCPCGLGEDYGSCCGRFHHGAAAPAAELLMRSRYSAFAVGDARAALVALDAVRALVGDAAQGPAAAVVDLAAERRRRDDGGSKE